MTVLSPAIAPNVDVILPALNEADAISWVLSRMPPGYRAIVVDNGSSDATADLALPHGAVVVTEAQKGFGSACWAGLQHATADIVCFMDCDASLDPADLPPLVSCVVEDSADLVIGARQPEPGAWPTHARLANRWLARRVRRVTATQITDLGPMRAMRREPLVELNLTDRRSGWPLEMVLAAAASNWRVTELPVPYARRSGRSKVTGTFKGTVVAVLDMRAQLKVHLAR